MCEPSVDGRRRTVRRLAPLLLPTSLCSVTRGLGARVRGGRAARRRRARRARRPHAQWNVLPGRDRRGSAVSETLRSVAGATLPPTEIDAASRSRMLAIARTVQRLDAARVAGRRPVWMPRPRVRCCAAVLLLCHIWRRDAGLDTSRNAPQRKIPAAPALWFEEAADSLAEPSGGSLIQVLS